MTEEVKDQRLRYKICTMCLRSLSLGDFVRNCRSKDGYRSNCRACSRIAKAAWYKRHQSLTKSRMQLRRKELKAYIAQAKSSPCIDCNKEYHHSLMDFDHVSGEKIDGVTNLASRTLSLDKVKKEIAKCELVCCMCHRIRTWNRLYPEDKIRPC